MASASSAPLIRKVLFFQKLKGTEKWYVYWLVEEEVLGIMGGMNNVFEKKMTNPERRALLKNVADSLLPSRWAQVFNERSLNFEIEEDKATVNYITNSTELPLIQSETERAQKIMKFLHQICSDYKAIEKKFVDEEKRKEIEKLDQRAKKRAAYFADVKNKSPSKNRRTRGPAKGAKFDAEAASPTPSP
uniref:Uncharacterized protein n=1 Tax=Panagrolaimus sp. JU765 TaxID=591449 RepID=A0AC34RTE8_9BILA